MAIDFEELLDEKTPEQLGSYVEQNPAALSEIDDFTGRTLLLEAVSSPDTYEHALELLNKGADSTVTDKNGKSVLEIAGLNLKADQVEEIQSRINKTNVTKANVAAQFAKGGRGVGAFAASRASKAPEGQSMGDIINSVPSVVTVS